MIETLESGHFPAMHPECGTACPSLPDSIIRWKFKEKHEELPVLRELYLLKLFRLFVVVVVVVVCLCVVGVDAEYPAVASHFHGLYSCLQLCCEGPGFTSVQEDGCGKEVHQSYLGTERSTPVVPNWFQTCQCRCCLCYPGEYLRL